MLIFKEKNTIVRAFDIVTEAIIINHVFATMRVDITNTERVW